MIDNFSATHEKPSIMQFIRRLDWWIILFICLLMGASLLILESASLEDNTVVRQIIRFGIGWSVLIGLLCLPASWIRKCTPLLYVCTLILLLFVLLIGTKAGGAQRWLDIGFIRLQPSEIAKLTVPMMIAYFTTRYDRTLRVRDVFSALILLIIPTGLILVEPDLGTSVLVFFGGAMALFLAGLPLWLTGIGALVGLSAGSIYWLFFIKDYQKQRVLTLFNPNADPFGSGYHIIQSQIAIGSGGIFGKGFRLGTQSQLSFLPESTTDFIFSVLAEEHGLFGVSLLLVCYGLIICRGLYGATKLNNRFAAVLCGSIFLMFFINIFVNIGMVSGILPIVGLPLSFISYGGSSILSLMAALGLALNLGASYQSREQQE